METVSINKSQRDLAIAGFSLALIVLICGGIAGGLNARRLEQGAKEVSQSQTLLLRLESLLSTLKDAETGQRGYLLTRKENYLAPFDRAETFLPDELSKLAALTASEPSLRPLLDRIRPKIAARMDLMRDTVRLAKAGQTAAALDLVRSDRGKAYMDQLRSEVGEFQAAQQLVLAQRRVEAARNFRVTLSSVIITVVIGVLLIGAIFRLYQRNARQRERALELIGEQKERLRITLAGIGDAVISTDFHANVVFLNSVAEELTGWTMQEAQGQPLTRVFRIVNESTRAEVDNPALRALREGRIIGLANHTILISKTGKESPIDDSAAPIRDARNNVVGAVLVFRDISLRKEEERQASERARLTATRAEFSLALMQKHDLKSVLDSACQILVQQLGLTWAGLWTVDASGKQLERQASAGDLQLSTTLPMRVEIASNWISSVAVNRRAATEVNPAEIDLLEGTPLASEPFVNCTAYPVQVEETLLGVLVLISRSPCADGTTFELQSLADFLAQYLERKHADELLQQRERQFRSMAESIPQLAWMAEPDGHIFWYNKRWYDYTGTTHEQMAGWGWNAVHDPQLLPEVMERWQRSLQSGTAFEMTFPLRGKDGTYRQFLTRSEPLLDADGRVARWFGTNTDVTVSVEVERRLKASEDHLRSILNSLAAFVGVTTPEGVITQVNDAALAMANLKPEQVIGVPVEKSFWLANSPENQARVHDAILLAQQGIPSRFDMQIQAAGGEPLTVDFMLQPMFNDQGQITHLVPSAIDITDRKKSELQLRDRERFIQRILDASPGLVYILDLKNRRTIFINEQVQTATGFSRDEVLESDSLMLERQVHPEDRQLLRDHLARMSQLQDEEVASVEYRFRHADDSYRWYISRDTVFSRDADGRAVQLLGVASDITARKEAERRIQDSEERFRQLADSMPQFVWVTNREGMNTFFNRRGCEYIGCDQESFHGELWVRSLHPDDREPAIELWRHSVRSGTIYEVEYRMRSKSGEYRWFLGRGVPVRDDKGEIVQWFGTCTDIEDFKRTESERQQLVSLVENSTDFIAMYREDLMPFYVNAAGQQMLGLRNLEAATATPAREFFFPEDQNRIVQQFLPSVLSTGSGETEVRFRHFQTGNAVWVLFRVFRIPDPQSNGYVLATVSRDISQRRQLEDNLRQLAADLSEADRRKDEFLATLAHELRNPLAPIRNGLQILKLAGQGGHAIEQARNMMDRQLSQMVRLVDDLLDVSRITRNKLELRKERVDLAAIIHSAVETSRPVIEASGHEFTVSLPDRPVFLHADLTRLAQVFSNLLNNAAKYTERGGQIWMSAGQDGDLAVVSVRDTGMGIPPAMLPKVFDMFTQVDRTLERSQGGLGIGLTLVRRLVEMHGGTVEARSEGERQGSEFIVRLPIEAEIEVAKDPDPPQEPQPVLVKRRILVVDDIPDAATSLSMLLKIMGNDVQVAHDGLEAVAAFEQFQPDVILLDIGLPRLNGYEACHAIRELPGGNRPVIIACTGWGQDEDRRRSQAAGFDSHMVKPIDITALENLLLQRDAQLNADTPPG